ncbi:4Fe-4S dicluster domain-containing protein [Geovibrio sp. ADMFC3]
MGIKDVREVMLYSGNCTECAFGDGKNFLRLQLKSLKRFSGSLKGCTISTGSSEHIVIRFSSFPRLSSIEKKQINVSRRGFFSLFGRELASGAFSAVDVLVEQSRESVNIGDSKKKSQRKVLFEKTISMLSPYIKKPLLFDRNIPFGTIRYSEENCDKCKLCITLCPSTALTKTEDGVIVHDSLSCTGCGVCIKACTNGCLQIEPESEYPQKLK